MAGILVTLRAWWERTDRNQRMLTLGGSALLVVLLLGTFLFASRPHYEILYTGLTLEEKGPIVQEIQAMASPATTTRRALSRCRPGSEKR